MKSNYTKIYTGSSIITQLIVSKLNAIGIYPIVKDETESGRLAGFGPSVMGSQELFVTDSDLQNAKQIVTDTLENMEQ